MIVGFYLLASVSIDNKKEGINNAKHFIVLKFVCG